MNKFNKQIWILLIILILSFVIIYLIGDIKIWPCTSNCNPDFHKCTLDGTSIISKCDVDYKGIPNNLEDEYMFFYIFGLPIISTGIIFYFIIKKLPKKPTKEDKE